MQKVIQSIKNVLTPKNDNDNNDDNNDNYNDKNKGKYSDYLRITNHDDIDIDGFLSLSATQLYRYYALETPPIPAMGGMNSTREFMG